MLLPGRIVALLFLLTGTFSCVQEEAADPKREISEEKIQAAPEVKITDTTSFKNDIINFPGTPGTVGIFDVPEMLVLSILDSASSKEMSKKVVENYALLEDELNTIQAEINGPIGMLTYNNNVNNFVFESVLFIKKMPKIQPKRSNLVVLEASQMLVYNFYGSYQNLFSAYDKIKRYCDKNNLLQSGPMREFYLTDPAKVRDTSKWLTRIMLPVIPMHKKTS